MTSPLGAAPIAPGVSPPRVSKAPQPHSLSTASRKRPLRSTIAPTAPTKTANPGLFSLRFEGVFLSDSGSGNLHESEKSPMPQKSRKNKKDTTRAHTHIAGTSGAGKKTYVAEVLKPTRESGQQFGSLDPHGDMLPMARELLSQPPTKRKRPAKKRT
jgi:DNA helicase HerA-like ATPase